MFGFQLWNVFFKGVDTPLIEKAYRGAKFANDLTAFKKFEASTPNEDVLGNLRDLQNQAHAWGERCVFDRTQCDGESFKLLGTMMDPKLVM